MQQEFADMLSDIARYIDGKPVTTDLAESLNEKLGVTSETFSKLKECCVAGETNGWLLQRAEGGIKFGRAIKPGAIPGDLSVDVVRMADVKGPHHVHPTGEIGLVIPIEGNPTFDGKSEGWYVYPPGSDHHPTVKGGDAYIVYFLPEGAIEFTGR